MNTLLNICIPTYKRVDFLQRLLNQLSAEINSLSTQDQKSISINLFENPSEFTPFKEGLGKSYSFGSASCSWQVNSRNIGGDANVEQCCTHGANSSYKWIIGDDEQLIANGLYYIISHLKSNPDCGLLLLRDSTYQINQHMLDKRRWNNYLAFARDSASFQPHLLIAHTLISCNIFKTSAYSERTSKNERLIYSARAGLPYCFSHMLGILTGLSREDNMSVHILLTPVIDTSCRASSETPEDSPGIFSASIMSRLYRHYLYWLGHEFGIDIDSISSHSSMHGIFNRASALPATSISNRIATHAIARLRACKRYAKELFG